jgi:NADP-reducing hydrogenase subunit HndC
MKPFRSMVLVSGDAASLQKGSKDVYRKFQEEIRVAGLAEDVALNTICDTGCQDGLPLVIIYPEAVAYGPVRPDDVKVIVDKHLRKGQIDKDLLTLFHSPASEIAWLGARRGTLPAEQRIVLGRSGLVDPDSLEDYSSHEGYLALSKAITQMTPQEVIKEIDESGLQGRGGAGFPTGRKWNFVSVASGYPKYVVCNADESEPGTFKDRVIIEGDPFSIVEAMTIAGYAVGASQGFIYVRGEYGQALHRLENAVRKARAGGLLGEHIYGSKFNFDITLHSGAGAYICGEETALIESIEGKRGIPRARPPYPPTWGLWGKPTLVNNVETLANVPAIIRYGSRWYHQFGTINNTGTKVLTILGNVNATGLVEVPFGITLREVIDIYGKGMKNSARLKLIQVGGSSGSILPANLQDTPLDYAALRKVGAALGSGALLFCDENNCVVDLARTIIRFFKFECCSKCTPCRIGTQSLFEILTNISEGKAREDDLQILQDLGNDMKQLSNCGLGQAAPVAVLDILNYFEPEVQEHIRSHHCPAGVCPIEQPVAVGQVSQQAML